MPATLGYVIATPSELPRVRTSQLEPHPNLPQGRALKKSPFFMTKTENAYDL